MNPFEMVIAIVAIVTIGSIIRTKQMAKYGIRDDRRGRVGIKGPFTVLGDGEESDSAETKRLREEVKSLKDRIQVLERIATDRENSLSREIEDLRKS